jgi:hypothetical protein
VCTADYQISQQNTSTEPKIIFNFSLSHTAQFIKTLNSRFCYDLVFGDLKKSFVCNNRRIS